MFIEETQLEITLQNEGTNIYLAQIKNEIDTDTKRLKNVVKKNEVITNVFESIKHKSNLSFLVFPEVSIPLNSLPHFFEKTKSYLPNNSVCILGVELMSISDYITLIKANDILETENFWNRIKEENLEEKLINVALIITKTNNQLNIFTQTKIQPSKFEGDIEYGKSLFDGEILKVFYANNLIFTVLICSDFFNRAKNQHQRIIDDLDYKILKEKNKPLDFIFNIQHNPAPDHDFFTHSLSRIYDDGHDNKKNICTIFLNSIISDNKGGLSKILFYQDKKSIIQGNKPIKLLKAPVKGIEIPQEELLIELNLELLPKAWDDRNSYPIKFNLKRLNANQTNTENFKIVLPMEIDNFLNYKSYEDLAKRLSDLGKFEKAIECERIAIKYYQGQHDYKNLAFAHKFIAMQYRHMGSFQQSLTAYAQAEAEAQKVLLENTGDHETKLLLWRIEAGRIMIKDYLIKVKCQDAIEKYQILSKEHEEYIADNILFLSEQEKREILSYKNHLNRQIAEMERIIGNYDKALNIFQQALVEYKFYQIEEQAYCIYGIANSERMLERFNDAMIHYDEAEEVAKHHHFDSLYIRILRNKCELLRHTQKDISKPLEKLKTMSYENEMRFGKIYYWLIKGCSNILSNSEEALSCFKDASILCKPDKDQETTLELAHTNFGIGEVKRIMGDLESANIHYLKALNVYRDKCGWGVKNITQAMQADENVKKIFIMNMP